jgi:hypothetical protein
MILKFYSKSILLPSKLSSWLDKVGHERMQKKIT